MPVSWKEFVERPEIGALKILVDQIGDRDRFIQERGLWQEFQAWLQQPRTDDRR